MAFQEGRLPVGTAPVPFVDPGIRGALIQALGTATLTIGGAAVGVNSGPTLAPSQPAVWVFGAPVVGAVQSDFLYAVQAGTAGGTIAWFSPV